MEDCSMTIRLLACLGLIMGIAACGGGTVGGEGPPASIDMATTPPDLTQPPMPDLALGPDLQPAPCMNGKKDGDETDVDCGGSCGHCLPDQACKGPGDCSSGVCTNM